MPALRVLRSLDGRLLSAMVSEIDICRSTMSSDHSAKVAVEDMSTHAPSDEQQSHWFERTQTIFDPLDAMSSLECHAVECPECGTGLDARTQTWISILRIGL